MSEQSAIERCNREIAECESKLRSDYPDVEGACLGLADWAAEKRMILGESRPIAHNRLDGSSPSGDTDVV